MKSKFLAIGFVLIVLTSLAGGCAVRNAYLDPAKPHHTETGFRNNHIGTVDKPFSDLVRWRYEALRDGRPAPAQTTTPRVAPDLARIRANAQAGAAMRPLATWIGHATVLVQAAGLNVLTDPHFSERASPVRFLGPQRAQPPGLTLEELPAIDAVVISHNHYDHLDRDSVVLLNERAQGRTLFLVPLGLKPWFERHGISNVVELDWWQSHRVRPRGGLPAVEFFLTPVQHWSARALHDRSQTLWGGWAVFAPSFHWYFAGDAGYSADFVDTRRHFERTRSIPSTAHLFDLALIPVGAYEPRWFMGAQHVNPEEAVQVHADIGAARSLGIHWGTFNLTDEPLDQPPQDLARARSAKSMPEDRFFLLAIGASRELPARQP